MLNSLESNATRYDCTWSKEYALCIQPLFNLLVLEEFKYKLMMRRRSIAERIKAFKIFLTEVYPEEIANLIEDIALHIGNLIYSNPVIFKKFKSRNVLTISSITFLLYKPYLLIIIISSHGYYDHHHATTYVFSSLLATCKIFWLGYRYN